MDRPGLSPPSIAERLERRAQAGQRAAGENDGHVALVRGAAAQVVERNMPVGGDLDAAGGRGGCGLSQRPLLDRAEHHAPADARADIDIGGAEPAARHVDF